MTDGQAVLLIIIGTIMVLWGKKKKKNQSAEYFFIDVVEVWQAPKKRSSSLANVLVAAGLIVFLIYVSNH